MCVRTVLMAFGQEAAAAKKGSSDPKDLSCPKTLGSLVLDQGSQVEVKPVCREPLLGVLC